MRCWPSASRNRSVFGVDPDVGSHIPNGLVRANGRGFVDDSGPLNTLGASLFWAGWSYLADRAKLERNLEFLASNGVDYLRVFGVVGPTGGWEDRVFGPQLGPQYWDAIGGVTDLIFKFGMRTQWTIFAGIDPLPRQSERLGHVEAFSDAISDAPEKLFIIEVANEGWQNGFPGRTGISEMVALGKVIRARIPTALVALTGPEDAMVCATYDGWDSIATLHYDRKIDDRGYRTIRQAWGYPDEYRDKENFRGVLPRIAVNNEPIGLQSSVATEDDPMKLVMAYATTLVAGNGAYTLHAGPGIRGGGQADLARGRAADWPDLPAAAEALRGIAAVRAQIKYDLPNGERQNAHWAGFPFEGLNDAVPNNLIRANAARFGQSYVMVLLGLQGEARGRARWPVKLRAIAPLTGETIQTWDLQTGQEVKFNSDQLGTGGILIGEPL